MLAGYERIRNGNAEKIGSKAAYVVSADPRHDLDVNPLREDRLLLIETVNTLEPMPGESPEEFGERFNNSVEIHTDRARGNKSSPAESMIDGYISFPKSDEENLTAERVLELTKEAMERQMGNLDDRVAVFAVHGDGENDGFHCHFMISTVDRKTGNVWNPHADAYAMQWVLEEMEIEYGLTRAEVRPACGRYPEEASAKGAEVQMAADGRMGWKQELKTIIKEASKSSENLSEFAQKLDEAGVAVLPQQNDKKGWYGVSYSFKGHYIKGSSLDKYNATASKLKTSLNHNLETDQDVLNTWAAAFDGLEQKQKEEYQNEQNSTHEASSVREAGGIENDQRSDAAVGRSERTATADAEVTAAEGSLERDNITAIATENVTEAETTEAAKVAEGSDATGSGAKDGKVNNVRSDRISPSVINHDSSSHSGSELADNQSSSDFVNFNASTESILKQLFSIDEMNNSSNSKDSGFFTSAFNKAEKATKSFLNSIFNNNNYEVIKHGLTNLFSGATALRWQSASGLDTALSDGAAKSVGARDVARARKLNSERTYQAARTTNEVNGGQSGRYVESNQTAIRELKESLAAIETASSINATESAYSEVFGNAAKQSADTQLELTKFVEQTDELSQATDRSLSEIERLGSTIQAINAALEAEENEEIAEDLDELLTPAEQARKETLAEREALAMKHEDYAEYRGIYDNLPMSAINQIEKTADNMNANPHYSKIITFIDVMKGFEERTPHVYDQYRSGFETEPQRAIEQEEVSETRQKFNELKQVTRDAFITKAMNAGESLSDYIERPENQARIKKYHAQLKTQDIAD